MSWDYTIYVGPFVECSTKTSPREKTINTCSDKKCRFHRERDSVGKDAEFCSKCGSAAEVITFEVEGEVCDDIGTWTVIEGTKERLTTGGTSNCGDEPGTHLFIPNQDWPRPFTYCRDDPKTGMLLDDIPTKVVEETAWLMRSFAKEIAFCMETYGEKNVRVRWGVLGSAG